MPEDLEVAKILIGLGQGQAAELAERGQRWIEATAHEPSPGKRAVSEVDHELLILKPEQLKKRLSAAG